MYADLDMENHAMKVLIALNSGVGRQAINGRPPDQAPSDVGGASLRPRREDHALNCQTYRLSIPAET